MWRSLWTWLAQGQKGERVFLRPRGEDLTEPGQLLHTGTVVTCHLLAFPWLFKFISVWRVPQWRRRPQVPAQSSVRDVRELWNLMLVHISRQS